MAKILIVDDEQESRALVKDVLGKEHDVVTAEDWIQVANYVTKQDFDLILMDVNMPGVKGDDLTTILKKRLGKTKPLNIVLFSSIEEDELREKAKEVNARGYIPKTFHKDILQIRVNRILREIKAETP